MSSSVATSSVGGGWGCWRVPAPQLPLGLTVAFLPLSPLPRLSAAHAERRCERPRRSCGSLRMKRLFLRETSTTAGCRAGGEALRGSPPHTVSRTTALPTCTGAASQRPSAQGAETGNGRAYAPTRPSAMRAAASARGDGLAQAARAREAAAAAPVGGFWAEGSGGTGRAGAPDGCTPSAGRATGRAPAAAAAVSAASDVASPAATPASALTPAASPNAPRRIPRCTATSGASSCSSDGPRSLPDAWSMAARTGSSSPRSSRGPRAGGGAAAPACPSSLSAPTAVAAAADAAALSAALSAPGAE